ncbi:MAG TPA: DUF5989 family protein [Candidatus Binataceae bacterium]|nr:DUF5989 family protein [Candidatus Binataceae bacterium]
MLKKIASRFRIVGELFDFARHNKMLWLAPVVILLLLITGLVISAQTSAVAPFIYTLF